MNSKITYTKVGDYYMPNLTLAERENITEELKANNQMEWVHSMNNIRNCVDEIIFKSYIYI